MCVGDGVSYLFILYYKKGSLLYLPFHILLSLFHNISWNSFYVVL